MKRKQQPMKVEIVKALPVAKADVPTQLPPEDFYSVDWLNHPVNMRGLRELVRNSSILPQCIQAYKSNICGFGIGVRYIEDTEETPEMAEEFSRAEKIIELLSTEQDTKEVFEDLVEARETYGIAYLEAIRDMSGNVVQIEFIRDTPSVYMTRPLDPYIETPYFHRGEETIRRKKYRKYMQELGGKTVYFKEFGDPRIMDNRSGEYLENGASLELQYQANEILDFPIGTQPYGEVRWVGQILGVDGSRKAENLNNNYFTNGRHTPLMILIKGGTLTDESFAKLQNYMEDIKGEAGQHAFIILEAESTDARVDFDQTEKPDVEIKELASILQKDELFQGYLENNRRRAQSAFRLPDLYVGYTTDFNRATAQTAQEVTEEQVFQPERKSLAWVINNRLLNSYGFHYVEAYFAEPDISNPDDLAKLLTIANQAGGLTPNKAKDIIYNALGETSEPYDGDWGDVPLAITNSPAGTAGPAPTEGLPEQPGPESAEQPGTPEETAPQVSEDTLSQLQEQIQKAAANNDDEIVSVMKEVRSLLTDMNNPGEVQKVFSWDESKHKRGDDGRFTSGSGSSGSSADGADGNGLPRMNSEAAAASAAASKKAGNFKGSSAKSPGSTKDFQQKKTGSKKSGKGGKGGKGSSSKTAVQTAREQAETRARLQAGVRSGSINTDIQPIIQNRYIPGTNEYKAASKGGKAPATLTLDRKQIESVIQQALSAGTATEKEDGSFSCTLRMEDVVGAVTQNNEGEPVGTHTVQVNFSAEGTHVIPVADADSE